MLRILAVIASAAVLIGAAVYVLACPCGPVPGLWLFGDRATEPVDDWAFVNDAGLCQLQVQTWKPHTLNLNCMSDNGDLFVSCSNCAGKSWSNHVLTKPQGYIKAGDAVYPVTLARVTAASELDRAWAARAAKVNRGSDAPRPDHWWSFQLTSR